MKKKPRNQHVAFKRMYEDPQIDLIQFSCVDIITASGDPNQGEWDPQVVDDIF